MSHTNLKPFLIMERFQASHGATYLEDTFHGTNGERFLFKRLNISYPQDRMSHQNLISRQPSKMKQGMSKLRSFIIMLLIQNLMIHSYPNSVRFSTF